MTTAPEGAVTLPGRTARGLYIAASVEHVKLMKAIEKAKAEHDKNFGGAQERWEFVSNIVYNNELLREVLRNLGGKL